MPFPVELLRFFEHATGGNPEAAAVPTAAAGPTTPAELPASDGGAPELPVGQADGVPAAVTRDSAADRG